MKSPGRSHGRADVYERAHAHFRVSASVSFLRASGRECARAYVRIVHMFVVVIVFHAVFVLI